MPELNIGALFERATRQAQRVLGDIHSSEDVAAEAVTRLIAGKDPDYLGIIVHGLAVDEYRRRGREVPSGNLGGSDDRRGLLDTDHLPHVQYLTPEADRFRRGFDAGVRALPDAEREAFLLTAVRGLTVREAEDVLGTPKSEVHRRAETARTFLKESL
jgi:RNA polymerase sigma factor (sigma-70 family)